MSDPDPVVQIIDDDAAVRNRLGSLLDTAGIRARTHESTTAFLAIADSLPPGCIVSEISMPDIDGLELVARLKAMGLGHPVIAMSGSAEVPLVVEAVRRGAIDFLEKPIDDVVFLNIIRAAIDASPDAIRRAACVHEAERALESLSGRERQVLDRLMQGKSTKLIATELRIGPRTVEEYRANLNIKMSVSSLAALVQTASLVLNTTYR